MAITSHESGIGQKNAGYSEAAGVWKMGVTTAFLGLCTPSPLPASLAVFSNNFKRFDRFTKPATSF